MIRRRRQQVVEFSLELEHVARGRYLRDFAARNIWMIRVGRL
jgi:hypothetical protein